MEYLGVVVGLLLMSLVLALVLKSISRSGASRCESCGQETETDHCFGCGRQICIACQTDDLCDSCYGEMKH